MYEFTEESFDQVINKISQKKTVEDIGKFVSNKVDGSLSITFPRTPTERFTITFLLDTKKVISFTDIAEIMDFICNTLTYDKVIVELKKAIDESNKKLFDDNTSYSKENLDGIRSFLKKHYSQFYTDKDKFTLFSGKDDLAVNTPENIDPNLNQKLITHLKANPELWNALISSSELWDNLQLQVKEELIKCSPRHKPQTPGSSIPV